MVKLQKVKLIAAVDEKGLIGIDNELPWNLKDELKHFKETTTGHAVVMGNSTHKSIGRALPNRKNIVFSRKLHHSNTENLIFCRELFQFYLITEDIETDIWLIGGTSLYKMFLGLGRVESMLITKVKGDYSSKDLNKQNFYFPYWNTPFLEEMFPKQTIVKETEDYTIVEYGS